MTAAAPDATDHAAPTRRGLLTRALGVAGAVAAAGVVGTPGASAAKRYRVRPYPKTKIPAPDQLHMMNRLGCGYSRATWKQLKAAGGAQAWFEQQLHPERDPDNALAESLITWFPDLLDSHERMLRNHRNNGKQGWEYALDLANYTMLRRIYSDHQVLETMVDFWSNHLHVPTRVDRAWVPRYDYDLLVRRHALGRFEDLLVECSLHPAMQIFLDNEKSVKDAPNENQGRELLELHTVGRASGYTEQMVKDSAKLLSGYTVDDSGSSWRTVYDPNQHTTGAVTVLDFAHPNGAGDGRALTREYLRHLARHPATAQTIARKLALRFVSDEPSAQLVDHLAKTFLASGTDIKATLRALVAHPEFRSSAGAKVRTPIEDLVATARVLEVKATKPGNGEAFARKISHVQGGMILYQWPRPDGPPDRNSAWSSATRVMVSFRMHWLFAGGFHPNRDVTYRSTASWLPKKKIRFDEYVDHLCRTLLGRPSTAAMLQAAVEATGVSPTTVVSKKSSVARYGGVRLIGALLDSPAHMTR
jgi:uncharacterized protein (DUF1800 family)